MLDRGAMDVMAKKPTKGRPKVADRKVSIASIKGVPAYRDWLTKLADFSRLPIALLIEHALFEYAETHEFTEPPPKR